MRQDKEIKGQKRIPNKKNMIKRERWFNKRKDKKKNYKITYLFPSFKMLFIFISFFLQTFTYSAFSISQFVFFFLLSSCFLWFLFLSFFLFSFFLFSCFLSFLSFFSSRFIYFLLLKYAAILIGRFGQTCIIKDQNEMLMLMNHPFARSLLHRTVRCIQTVTINSAQPDFDIEISHCSCSVMRGHYSSILVSNERRWIELCNNEHSILWMIQFQWKYNCSFGFPFYWDALYRPKIAVRRCCGSVDKTTDSQSWGPWFISTASCSSALGRGTVSSLSSP